MKASDEQAAVRKQRADRRAEEARIEANDDGASMWELKYTFSEPVGAVRIVEDWSGEGNGIAGLQWLGGVMLCRYMDSRQVFAEDHFVGKRIIEVGAGCGLTSIYAALRGADVTLTDMDTEKCRDSIEVNFTPRGLPLNTLHVAEVVWGETDLQQLNPPFDIILAGDCLYQSECIEPLLSTMHALAGEHTLILLCGAVGPKIIDAFNARVDHYFTRSIVDTKAVDTLGEIETSSPSPSVATPVTAERSPVAQELSAGGEQPGQRALLVMRKRALQADTAATAAAAVSGSTHVEADAHHHHQQQQQQQQQCEPSADDCCTNSEDTAATAAVADQLSAVTLHE